MGIDKKKFLELQEQDDIYINNRRSSKGFSQVIYRSRDKERPDIFDSQVKYNFLQYTRLIFQWATKKTGLDRDHLELLLYLQPIGVFNEFQIESMCRTVNMHHKKPFNKLLKGNFIKIWREEKKDQPALYTLTQQSSLVCTLIHKMVIGEEQVPGAVFREKKKASNKYYLDLIKEMEAKKAGRDSNPHK